MLCSAVPKSSLEFSRNRREKCYPSYHPRMIQGLFASGLCYQLIVWSNSKVGSGWPAVGSNGGV